MNRTKGLRASIGILAVSGGLLFSQSPAMAAEGDPIPGIDVKLGKNPGAGLSGSVGGIVFASGAAVTDPVLEVHIRTGANPLVVVVVGSTTGHLVQSFQTAGVSFSLYEPSTGGVA